MVPELAGGLAEALRGKEMHGLELVFARESATDSGLDLRRGRSPKLEFSRFTSSPPNVKFEQLKALRSIYLL